MINYNINAVVKIRVIEKYASHKWSWYPAEPKKLFGLIKAKPAGFVDFYSWEKEIEEECPVSHYLEKSKKTDNMIVYENPQVTMWFNDGSQRTFYFETVEEANDTAQMIKKKSGCEWYEHK